LNLPHALSHVLLVAQVSCELGRFVTVRMLYLETTLCASEFPCRNLFGRDVHFQSKPIFKQRKEHGTSQRWSIHRAVGHCGSDGVLFRTHPAGAPSDPGTIFHPETVGCIWKQRFIFMGAWHSRIVLEPAKCSPDQSCRRHAQCIEMSRRKTKRVRAATA